MTDLIRSQIDFIYFVYGLGFFLLLPICLYLHRRSESSLPWIWLLLFGATHGLMEWLDLAALSLGTDPVFDVVRLGLLILSFLLLAEFGRAGLVRLRGRGPGRWVLAALLGLALLGAFAGLPGLRASSRYALGLVGALGAAAALWLAAHRAGPGRRALQGAALCLAGYAAAAGLVVDPAPFFPASRFNTEVFLAGVGVPVQLGRGFLAAGLSACLALFAVASLGQEKHRRLQKWGRNLMVGSVVSILALVISAWCVTLHFGRNAAREVRSGQEHQAQVLEVSLENKMTEADYLVTTLAGAAEVISFLSSQTSQSRARVHTILDRYSAVLPGIIMSVLDREGLTIASSKRLGSDSFLGKSYRVCYYFQQALQGARGSCWDLEVTSGEPAYCASFPVRDGRNEIIGVAVIQRIMRDLGGLFPHEALVVIIETHGVVVQANRPDMFLKSLWPLSAAVQEQLSASRQFGPGPFAPILAQAPVDGGYCRFQGRPYLVLRQPLPFQDWSIVILTSPRPIAVARMLGLSIGILACLAVLSLLTIIGLTIESTSRVQRSENRFRQLYDNLRDGSAVVDLSGNLVEWNPAFQAMLGYPPEELSQLSLRDLTPETWQEEEARIIAEEVLPRGFSRLYEQEYRRRDGSVVPVELQTYLIQEDGEQAGRMWIFVRDITKRRQAEAALGKRLIALSKPLDDPEGIYFHDLFNIEDIQRIQDLFAKATGVASIITNPDGTPITKPINFCRLCIDIIRQTELGLKNCYYSDAIIGRHHTEGPVVQPCLSGGLWDAGASITVGGRHIANWLIGQVRNEAQSEENMREYARQIGVNEEEFIKAFYEVITMPESQFKQVADALFALANQLSAIAYQNVQQARFITERKKAEDALQESEQKYWLLLANIPATVFTGYADWAVDFHDDKIEELTGYSKEEFEARRLKWSDMILTEDFSRIKEIFLKALKSTRAYVREYRIRAKNGDILWVRERARIACDPQGRIVQVTGVFSDITEQHNLAQELEELRRQQEMILNNAGEGIFGLNRQGEVTFANPAAAAMIGYDPGELVGRPMHDLVHHTREDGTQHLRKDCPIYAALQSGEARQVSDDSFWRQDGQGFPVEYVATPVIDQGQTVGAVVVFKDITRRRRDEAALARANDHLSRLVVEAEERHRTVSLLKDMVDGLQSCHTTEEAYAAISLSAARLFPEDSGALYLLNSSQNYFEAMAAWGESPPAEAIFAPDDCWSVRRNRLHLVTASHPELPCRHLTDSWSGDYLCVPMMVQGGAPGVLHVRLSPPRTPGRTAEDLKTQAESRLQLAVSVAEHLGLSLANLKLQETLRQQAIRDPLTGLFNRRYLEETLDRELVRARRENAPVGVIMMDLDHFKQFNDAFGHGAGDTLLRELGQLIQRRIREEDVPCRWGGEEFLLIMPGASMDIVRARAEEIRRDVKQLRVEDRGKPLGPITISLGAATFPEHGATREEIIRAADAALYRAKQAGRDRVVVTDGGRA